MNERNDGLLFLDTAKLEEIEKYLKLGFVDGVTTNPTIMKKDGVTGGFAAIKKRTIEIAKLINPRPLSVETSSPEGNKEELIQQAREFADWANNINVKVTFTTQEGIPNTDVIRQLAFEGISVNATAMMSVSQCFIAAKVGAKYVSIFLGRVANMGYDPITETLRLRELLDRTGLPAQIIAASSREPFNVIQWFEAGAHVVTVTPDLLKPCIDHPYTRDTVKMFDNDAVTWLAECREYLKNKR
jgi:transaldolase